MYMKKIRIILSILAASAAFSCNPVDPEPDPQPGPDKPVKPDNGFEISSADQFASFLKSSTDKTKDTYKIVKSFDCSGVTLPSAAGFSGTLDGGGFTISGLNCSSALFASNSGTIKDLTLAGTFKATSGNLASFVITNTSTGKLSGCHNNASVSIDSGSDIKTATVIGGLAAFNLGRIENCSNEAKVSVNTTGMLSGTAVGGIAGYIAGSVTNSQNKGEVSLSGTCISSTSVIGGVSDAATSLGGIAGLAYTGFSASSCTNSGPVNYTFKSIEKLSASIGRQQIGGIVGSSSGTIQSCTNEGTVTVKAKTSAGDAFSDNSFLVCVGGIAGGEYYAPNQNVTDIISCTNKAPLNVDTDYSGANNTLGGIVGWPNKEAAVSNKTQDCINQGDLTVQGKGKIRAAGIQGGTGNLSGCKNSGKIEVLSSASTSTIGGICAFHSQSHYIRQCENTGDVISNVAIAGAGGLIGNHGNAAGSTGEDCKVNCKVKNIDAEGKCTGMVVGYWNGTSATITLGSLTAPIDVEGQISYGSSYTTITVDNFSKSLAGKANESDAHTIVTTRSASAAGKAEGYVKYSDGSPATGIAVSDGFTVAITDSQGHYTIDTDKDCWYIYISLPADAAVARNSDGSPDFFKRYESVRSSYDFTLTRQEVEKRFAIFALADPQAHYSIRSPQKKADTDRFRDETVPALNAKASAAGIPCYGITLGDVVYSEGSRNSNPGLTVMRGHFKGVNFPVFQTMGNHDYTYFYSNAALTPDGSSSTTYIKAQRKFEDTFGPVNYSFNRGEVHFVCMRNINYDSTTDAGSYHGGFTTEQYNWLKADLAAVPASSPVVLCVHIPICGITGKENVSNVISLMKQHPGSTIFSGHTHYKRGYDNILSSGIYEHIHSAVCGQWWWSNIEGDGCPNGYTIYTFDGKNIVDEYFCGFNKSMDSRDYQIRMYRGNTTCGGSYAYFKWPHASNVILINVFNGDSRWKSIKVYENGVYSGTATLIPNKRVTYSSVSKGQTYTVDAASCQDWWAIGYNIGVVGRGTSSTSYYTNEFHMYKFTLKNASAKVMVEAEDPYGTVYRCDELIEDGTKYPSYVAAGNN